MRFHLKRDKRRNRMNKKQVQDYIDENAKIFTDVSDKIWEYAELSLKEFQSCALYVKLLK